MKRPCNDGRFGALRRRGRRDWRKRQRSWPRRLGVLSAWRAYTASSLRTVNLGPNVCFELRKLIHDDEPVWRDPYPGALARSVQALAHESVHASGDVNEARAECSGLQKIVEAAVELGRTPKEGRYLARLYWRAWYPRHAVPYRSTECRDGGRLDFSPETRAWP